MAQLPYLKLKDDAADLIETKWRAILNPVLAIPMLNGIQLNNISLASGVNVINHFLGRIQQGWLLTDINSGVAVYRSQPLNAVNLVLNSGGVCVVSLWVW